MYVCLCKNITQKQLEEAVEQGYGYAQIRQNMGLATDCGSCGQNAKQIIRTHISKLPSCEFSEVS